MKTVVMISLLVVAVGATAKQSFKKDRTPNQMSDLSHEFECTGKTKIGKIISISGKTDALYNLVGSLDLRIIWKGNADPSMTTPYNFAYDSSHVQEDKANHKNVFTFIRSPEDEVVLNYASGSKANKLIVLDFNTDNKERYEAIASTVVCKGKQIGSYQ